LLDGAGVADGDRDGTEGAGVVAIDGAADVVAPGDVLCAAVARGLGEGLAAS
jgi:hypothetical protein